MNTPTFFYHRAMILAAGAFCLHYFLNLLINHLFTVKDDQSQEGLPDPDDLGTMNQYVYGAWFWAFYSGVWYHAVQVTLTYLIQVIYLLVDTMTLIIV